jgi:DNA-binding MarR family transcriptional regulator
MDCIESTGSDEMRRRRLLVAAIRQSLRELINQLSLLNHQVSAHLELKDVDLDCLDLINRDGPMTPSALARRAGLHPATMTGILDRLERGGWIARDREPADRRAVLIRAKRERGGELMGLYSGMNDQLNQICDLYGAPELEVLADFLRRTTLAGRGATEELAGDGGSR